MLMRSQVMRDIFLISLLSSACFPNLREEITIDSREQGAQAEKTDSTPASNRLTHGVERLSFDIQIPIFMPEGAEANSQAKVLALSCSPAVSILKQRAELLNSDLRHIKFQLAVEAYAYEINCNSLVIADKGERFFESSLQERIRIPRPDEPADLAGKLDPRELEVTVGFQPIVLPQSALIEEQIAREIALQEQEKQRLEQEAAQALAYQEELERQLREIEANQKRLSKLEKELAEERKRLLAAEKLATESLLKRIETEKQLAAAKEEKERLKRELERESSLKREALEKLREKENQLAEERLKSREDIEKRKFPLKTVELSDPQFVQCPEGSKLNIELMICE